MVAQRDKIRTIDGFVGIIDEFVRTMDLLLENKKIAQKKMLNWAGHIVHTPTPASPHTHPS